MPTKYSTLRLGSGTDTVPEQWNVDLHAVDGVDETVDLNEHPWPWDDESWAEIVAEHVFEHLDSMQAALDECARILKPNGVLEIALPMGRDAYADATHVWGERHLPWTYRTPEFYTGQRHWDEDCGLELVDRSIDVWSVHPSDGVGAVQQWYWRRKLDRYGPGEWCFDLRPMCGEFRVVFRKHDR